MKKYILATLSLLLVSTVASASLWSARFPEYSATVINYSNKDLSTLRVKVRLQCSDFLGASHSQGEPLFAQIESDGKFSFSSKKVKCPEYSPHHWSISIVEGDKYLAGLDGLFIGKDATNLPPTLSLIEIAPVTLTLKTASGISISEWLKLPENTGKKFYYDLNRYATYGYGVFLDVYSNKVEIIDDSPIQIQGLHTILGRDVLPTDVVEWRAEVWFTNPSTGYYGGKVYDQKVPVGITDVPPEEILEPVLTTPQ